MSSVIALNIRLSFGIAVREGPVNVDAQDCFIFFTQEMYEWVLLDWPVRMGLKDGSLEVVYTPTVFSPAHFCAFMYGLNGISGVVEALCENVVLFTETIYYVEFFGRSECEYMQQLLAKLMKKIVLLLTGVRII